MGQVCELLRTRHSVRHPVRDPCRGLRPGYGSRESLNFDRFLLRGQPSFDLTCLTLFRFCPTGPATEGPESKVNSRRWTPSRLRRKGGRILRPPPPWLRSLIRRALLGRVPPCLLCGPCMGWPLFGTAPFQ